jgi:hypothetical protein
MKTIIPYLFWKNVYHNWLLYKVTWLFCFCISSRFRKRVRLRWACSRVERQDEMRIFWFRINRTLHQISDHIIIAQYVLNQLKEKGLIP